MMKWPVGQVEMGVAESLADLALLGLSGLNTVPFLLQTTSWRRRRCSPSVTSGLVSSN